MQQSTRKKPKRIDTHSVANSFLEIGSARYMLAQEAINDSLFRFSRGAPKEYDLLEKNRDRTSCFRPPYDARELGYFNPDKVEWGVAFIMFWQIDGKGTAEEAIDLWPKVWEILPSVWNAHIEEEKAEQIAFAERNRAEMENLAVKR